MDNITTSNTADVLAVTTVDERTIQKVEACSPKACVFNPYLD